VPAAAVVTIALPGSFEAGFVERIYAGMSALARKHEVAIVGGETTTNPERLLISVALLGHVPRGKATLRSGAEAGDAIIVTGDLGGSLSGKHLEFDPRRAEARWLTQHFSIHAMLDVSDGRAGDLRHICEKSGVSARLHAEKLPVSSENRALSRAAHGDEWHFALHGGEDYELLFTAPPARAGQLAQRITSETSTPVSVIGEILPAGERPELVLPDGSSHPLEESGWDHFK
jgi:thiamine-monophosphate kinase